MSAHRITGVDGRCISTDACLYSSIHCFLHLLPQPSCCTASMRCVSESARRKETRTSAPTMSTQAAGASPAAILRSVPLPRGYLLRFPSPLLGICWELVPRVVRQSRTMESCVGSETSNEGFFLPRESCVFFPTWRQSLTQHANNDMRQLTWLRWLASQIHL